MVDTFAHGNIEEHAWGFTLPMPVIASLVILGIVIMALIALVISFYPEYFDRDLWKKKLQGLKRPKSNKEEKLP